MADTDVQKVASLITAISNLIIYILTEGYVDAKRVENENKEVD